VSFFQCHRATISAFGESPLRPRSRRPQDFHHRHDVDEQSFKQIALGITLCAVVAAWVPFRAVSLEQAMTMLKSMFVDFSFGFSFSVNFYLMALIWCAWIALEPTFSKLLGRMGEPDRPGFFGALNGYLLRPGGYGVLLLLFMAFDDRDTQFIYFQF
jgi:hypothetical protein